MYILRIRSVAIVAFVILSLSCAHPGAESPEQDDLAERGDEVEAQPQKEAASASEGSDEKADADPVTSSVCRKLDAETYGNRELQADLNGDGRLDMVIENLQRCGPSMCPVDVLAACEGGGYEVVAHLDYFTPGGLTRGEDTNAGWHELHANTAKRDKDELWETTAVVFVWNGETYELAEE